MYVLDSQSVINVKDCLAYTMGCISNIFVDNYCNREATFRYIHSVAINEFPKWKNARFFSQCFVFKTISNNTYHFKIIILHTNI